MNTAPKRPAATSTEDKRLERLYDYTKFHIGIYLSAAGALVALIAASAKEGSWPFIATLIGWRTPLIVSFACVVVAGACGAIVATSAIESLTFEKFKDEKQGAFGIGLMGGLWWVRFEHLFFWASLTFLCMAIFSAPSTWGWLRGQATPTCAGAAPSNSTPGSK
jgi:hypothetical protein